MFSVETRTIPNNTVEINCDLDCRGRNFFSSISKSPGYPPIDKLEEGNYRSWHIDIRSRLRIRELWKYTEKRPEGLDAMAEEQWKEGATEAADFMTPTISRSIKAMLLHGNDYDDAYTMMTKLAAYFRPTGDAEFMRLTKELYTVKHDQFSSISDYHTHIKILKGRISETNVKMTDDMEYLLIYSLSLPEEYQFLVKLWSMTPNMTAEIALKTLLDEERRLKHVEETTPQWASSASRKRTHSDMRATAERFCRTCNKPHSELSCWRLHPELMPEWLKAKKAKAIKTKTSP